MRPAPAHKAGSGLPVAGFGIGEIQTISTDHCSFTTAQKELGREDFTKIPGGMPGVETRAVLLYTYGVETGRIRPEDMCRLLAENPAKLYGMFPQKGILAPGSDADIVVMRTGVSDTITASGQLQNVDYAPFEGWETSARVEQVFLRGRHVVQDDALSQSKNREGMWREEDTAFKRKDMFLEGCNGREFPFYSERGRAVYAGG